MVENYTRYRGFIIPAGIVVALLAVTVMIGWIYHIDVLTSLVPGYAAMKFNTAICTMLLSLALIFLLQPSETMHRVGKAFTVFAFILGTLSFIQHLATYDFKVDRLFFSHDSEPNHFHVFEMSPQTGFCISLMSFALLCLKVKDKRFRKVIQYLFHFITVMAFVVIIGYIYNVPNFHTLSFVSSMSVPTALAFVLLSIAASLINPSIGITGMFTGQRIGNLMARRLFFSMVAAILLAGYLRMLSHRNGLINVEFGIALYTVGFCVISLILIYIVSNILNKAYEKIHIARENLKMVVEAAPYGLILSEAEGLITEVNDQATRMFGYTKEEMVGQNVSMLVPEHSIEFWESRKKDFFSASQSYGINEEIISVRKNGEEFSTEIVLTPIMTESGLKILSFVIDVTARKNNEKIIQKQLIELQSKNQELEQFNYISSHDLQEPLRTVLNYIQLIEEDYPDLNSEVKDHLSMMGSAVTRMSTVVRSLLDFGRLGRNKKLVLTDVKATISDVITDLDKLIRTTGAKVAVTCELPELYAYQTELRQLFQNLISNAIKFRKEGTIPEIEICCKVLKGYYELSVSDNGIGIAPKHHDKIFHIFQRLNKEEDYEGHGIGLANCKKIAEMHGGKIWVESEPGKGSTFRFTILNFKS